MVKSIKQHFNRESIDPVSEEPILVGTREVDGVRKYMVHQYNGFWSETLPGGEDADDIREYTAQEYDAKFGNHPPRTLEAVKSEYDELQSARYDALKAAEKFIESHTNYKIGHYGRDEMNAMQKNINEIVGEMYQTGSNDMVKEAMELSEKAYEIGKNAKDIRDRLASIGEDMDDLNISRPALVAGFHH